MRRCEQRISALISNAYEVVLLLRQRASELPGVRTCYGWSVDQVRQTDEGVDVEIFEWKGQKRKLLHAQYVVACDGSRSIVRDQAGIKLNRADHDRLMVLLVFRSNELHSLLERFPGKSFYNVLHPNLKGYWQFFGRVDLGTTFFFHAPVPADTTRDNFDFDALLHQAAGAKFDVELQHIGFWDLRFAVAESYRAGRIFVAGDAAHSHPPYGGYGINTGFEDAVNLGWKLAAKLQGWAGDELLDSYDAERRPVFESTATDFIAKSISVDREFLEKFDPRENRLAFEAHWNARATGAKSEVASFEPNYEGSPVVGGNASGKVSAVGKHAVQARPGHHLTPRTLSSGKNVFEELGPDFTLIALGVDSNVVARFEAAANVRGIPLRIVQDTPADGRDGYEARLILVRPDQFVAWSSSRFDADPTPILMRSIGAREQLLATA